MKVLFRLKGAGGERIGNIQHSTFNTERSLLPRVSRARKWMLDVGCWMLDVFRLQKFGFGLFCLFAAFLAFGAAEPPSSPVVLGPEQAAKEGRELAAEILAQKPDRNSTNSGVLKIRDAKGKGTEMLVQFEIAITNSGWTSFYEAKRGSDGIPIARLTVVHSDNSLNQYLFSQDENGLAAGIIARKQLGGNDAMIPFAKSDFWLADLGLEFFHWPDQRLTKKEMRRGRACRVLESINPNPAPNTYSRVVSWIDNETDGIIHAEAYDAQGKLLKVFDPKEFKKVNGQWQLEEMDIRNVQTGSRTRIEFQFNHE